MIELGEYAPSSGFAPTRSITGTSLGRNTVTEEQRAEVIEWAVEQIAEHKGSEHQGRVKVNWPGAEPTVLEVTTVVEHLSGKRVWIYDRLREFTLSGGEIAQTEEHRVRRLISEVAELHERSML